MSGLLKNFLDPLMFCFSLELLALVSSIWVKRPKVKAKQKVLKNSLESTTYISLDYENDRHASDKSWDLTVIF